MSLYSILQWIYLGWIDIKGRYRRTVLGPFWLVATTFLSIAMMGVIYSTIFKVEINEFIPYIAAGIVAWYFISGVIMESCNGLISNKFLLLSKPIPIFLINMRILSRHVIIFFHNMIVLILCLLYFGRLQDVLIFPTILGIIFNCAIVIALGIFLSLICARFRDIVQVITSLINILFLITPIVWNKKVLESRDFLAEWNLFSHLVDLIRSPLLGQIPSIESYTISFAFFVFIALLAYISSRKLRNFMYWL
ncbi:hypothetical protein B1A99_22115 [Cohnella sp. CIP 111063]|uniref:ABC transporter permease n=1 Tax=unclassified Cohnella TaxID=2636738 RepID=UPI000B8C48F7|nr:hypothetical protein B1A99_22115 [Cohnella sp. CIP 111063]PRX67127.1 lipopolysaccharide transport system permease protein [Cohnella sp. SGD-V74]